MAVRNSEDTFGWVTKFLHWATALAVLVALPMGLWISRMEFSLEGLKYFGYHKTLGILVLVLIVIRILWHRVSPPPAPLAHGVGWQDALARWVHRGFYILLLAMPLSGWIASSATGIDTVIFQRWTLPSIAPEDPRWEDIGFAVHAVFGKFLMALVLLHVGGALYRAAIRDGTLRRML